MTFVIVMGFHQIIVVMNDVKQHTYIHTHTHLWHTGYHKKSLSENACTSKENSWLPPSLKEVPVRPLSDINFKSTKPNLPFGSKEESVPSKKAKRVATPSDEEKCIFLQKLSNSGTDSAILRITPKYSDKYILVLSKMKQQLTNIYVAHSRKRDLLQKVRL